MTMDESIYKNNILKLSILLSFVLHFLAIQLIHFKPIKPFKNQLSQIEVVLTNSKDNHQEDADVLAQSNSNKGGNTEKDAHKKTPLPMITENKNTFQLNNRVDQSTVGKASSSSQEKIVKKDAQVLNEPKAVQQPKESKVINKSISKEEILASASEISASDAALSNQISNFEKQPRRKYIGARTKEYKYALYAEAWRQKVETLGNMNYPEEAREKKFSGQLRMTVSLKPDGRIDNIEINQSSGFKILDDAAKRIVELGAPYATFPEDIRKEVDILSITRTWTFTKDDTLSSQ
ncbi:energy transducer TonB [Candidatus Methylopumilus universalis]|nr:energy transducer TonB [Candidatus Methylopumilus universalis]QDC72442.1 energy transducer TonB [Candidatus Methylopumilus universalis]